MNITIIRPLKAKPAFCGPLSLAHVHHVAPGVFLPPLGILPGLGVCLDFLQVMRPRVNQFLRLFRAGVQRASDLFRLAKN